MDLTLGVAMRYERVYIDVEKLKTIIKARGFKEREFCVIMWGDDTHRTINEFKRRPNTTIETAMKVCNTLDISLDELFSGSDKIGDSPYIIGDQNIVNSAVINQDAKSLQSENEDIDLAATVTQLSSAQVTYEASLMATGKISQTSLMNYI